MKTPRFFLSCVLVFWGFSYQMVFVGIVFACILEGTALLKLQYDLKTADFNKFADVSFVCVAGLVILAFSKESYKAIYMILQWLPLTFFPVVLAQQISVAGKINVLAFSPVQKRRFNTALGLSGKEIDISYGYAVLCLLCAGSTRLETAWFYPGLALFVFWGLWPVRPRRLPPVFWIAGMAACIATGFFGQQEYYQLRKQISRMFMDWYMNYYNADPFETRTSLGDVNDLKLSGRVVLRIKIPEKDRQPVPFLLQNATYNNFAVSNWYARTTFEEVPPQKDHTLWQLNPKGANERQMIIYSRLFKGKALLYLPPGVTRISEMKTDLCEKSNFQSVRIEGGPSLVKTHAFYTGRFQFDAVPDSRDLLVTRKEQPGIQKAIAQMDLKGKTPAHVLEMLKFQFATSFKYSLALKGKGAFETSLENFLLGDRSGHCELFATSSVLILRSLDIPARYVTGFMVHEYASDRNQFVVRKRDAHAWVKVYMDGAWQVFDPTPEGWLSADMETSDPSRLLDFLSWLKFELDVFRYERARDMLEKYSLVLIIPLGLILIFRLRKGNSIKRVKKGGVEKPGERLKERSKMFIRLEKVLSRKGYQRYPHETYRSWFKRAGECFDSKPVREAFLGLHPVLEQLLYSAKLLDNDEKKEFDKQAEQILTYLEE